MRATPKATVRLTVLVAIATALSVPPPARAAPGKLVLHGCQSSAERPPAAGCSQLEGLGFTHAVAFSRDGRSAYASFPGGISAFGRNRATGSLSFLECFDATGGDPCTQIPGILGTVGDIAVTPDGRSLYAAGGRRQVLISFRRDPLDGSLSFVSCRYSSYGAPGDLPGCPVGNFEEARQVESSRDGGAIYLADRSCADNTGECFAGVHAYRRNRETSVLRARDTSDGATYGEGPFAVGPGTLYQADSGLGTINVFMQVAAAGLRRVQCLWPRRTPGFDARCVKEPAMRRAQAIVLSPNGRNLVTAVGLARRKGGLGVFDRSRSGLLAFRRCLAPGTGVRGCQPLGMNGGLGSIDQLEFSADGRSLYAVSGPDEGHFLVRFKVSPKRGRIAFAQCLSAVRRRGCTRVRLLRGLSEIAPYGRFVYALVNNREAGHGPNALVRFRARR